MIDPAVVQRVREEVPLLDVARAAGLELRQRGGDWWAACPFHVEKSGSFKINEKKNRYKCFGCGAAGDVIGFHIAVNGLDAKRGFVEAVRALAQRAGIDVGDRKADTGNRKAQAAGKRTKRTREEIVAQRERRRALALAERARQSREAILREYAWSLADIYESSPVRIDEEPVAQARALFRLFAPTDLVWAGDVQHSIAKEDVATARADWKKEVARHFRTAGDWIRAGELPGPRVCASSFGGTIGESDAGRAGSDAGRAGPVYSRSQERVLRARFLVVEHDRLSLDHQGALLRWLREKAGLGLRAIVFTGGKSLHGWFDFPAELRDLARLRLMLCGMQDDVVTEGRSQRVWRGGMGFDAAIFNPVQPWKVPGWPHPKTGNLCTLLWMSDAGRAVRCRTGESDAGQARSGGAR